MGLASTKLYQMEKYKELKVMAQRRLATMQHTNVKQELDKLSMLVFSVRGTCTVKILKPSILIVGYQTPKIKSTFSNRLPRPQKRLKIIKRSDKLKLRLNVRSYGTHFLRLENLTT